MTATLPTSASPMSTGRGSRGWLWLLLAAAVVVVALLGGQPDDEGVPLSPRSVGPSGAKALREVLGAFGADVTVADDVASDADVVLVLEDDLTDGQRTDLGDWVEAGGRLVIADPASPFTPLVADPFAGGIVGGAGLDEPRLPEDCTIAALAGVGAIEPGSATDYEVESPDEQCFGPDGTAFVVASPRGAGVVVAVGGASVFTNERLDEADNAVLAVHLIAPVAGTRVTWLERDRSAPAAEESLWSLVGPGPRAALLQLALAAAVYVVVRGRRLGRPLHEPQPVQLAGSELVVAVGHMMQQGRDPGRAARLLRADLRRSVRERLGLPAETSPEMLAQIVATRFGVPVERATHALGEQPVASEQALVALARDVEFLRMEVLHGHAATEPRA
jgi:hypothetical protein